MADVKISALTAKGAKLETTDLIPIADYNGSSYDTKYVTGEQILEAMPVAFVLNVGDETTPITSGTGKYTFRMPFAMNVTSVRATLTSSPTTSGTFQVDINNSGVSILSTKITIDINEYTSFTAAVPPVISLAGQLNDQEITIDVDSISSGGTEAGLKVYLIGFAAL
jgi:hypothetical protein